LAYLLARKPFAQSEACDQYFARGEAAIWGA
jgi:hypothetical protein